jgi:hypothetical protein
MHKKKGIAGITVGIFLVIILIVAIFAGPSIMSWATTGEIPVGPSGGSERCDTGETQSLDLNSFALGAPSTALTEANNIIREFGTSSAPTAFTEGTAATGLEAGSTMEVIYGAGTTDYDNAYGPHLKISNLPCVMVETVVLFNDELEGSVSGTFYNKDGNAAAQTLTASTPVTVSFLFSTADKEYFGNPYIGEVDYLAAINTEGWSNIKKSGLTYLKGSAKSDGHSPEYPNIACIALNASNHNEPLWAEALLPTGSRVRLDRIEEPGVHSDTSGDNDYCYEAPVLSVSETEIFIRLDPKADVTGADDGTLSYYASSWWVHSESGDIEWGVEDNDDAAIGASNPDTVTADFTA